jgi:hypothetical protein
VVLTAAGLASAASASAALTLSSHCERREC